MNNPTSLPFIDHRFRPLGISLASLAFLAYAWFVVQGLASTAESGLGGLINVLMFRSQPELASRWIRSLFLVGILLVILAREQREDEWIHQTRLKSLGTTLLISLLSIVGYTIVGPVTPERLVSANVWLNLTALTYLIIFSQNLRSGVSEPAT